MLGSFKTGDIAPGTFFHHYLFCPLKRFIMFSCWIFFCFFLHRAGYIFSPLPFLSIDKFHHIFMLNIFLFFLLRLFLFFITSFLFFFLSFSHCPFCLSVFRCFCFSFPVHDLSQNENNIFFCIYNTAGDGWFFTRHLLLHPGGFLLLHGIWGL